MRSTFFGFAQDTLHDFQNTILNSKWDCLRQMPQKKYRRYRFHVLGQIHRYILWKKGQIWKKIPNRFYNGKHECSSFKIIFYCFEIQCMILSHTALRLKWLRQR